MSQIQQLRDLVRVRANYTCEFCGVTEQTAGGLLTLDHFQPRAKGGTDSLENLVYACSNCNQYKQSYWPDHSTVPMLWNPRHNSYEAHFILLDDGQLLGLTTQGKFTIQRLRLNRPAIISYRLSQSVQAESIRLLRRYHNLVELLTQLNQQLVDLTIEQQGLLESQRELLRLLTNNPPLKPD